MLFGSYVRRRPRYRDGISVSVTHDLSVCAVCSWVRKTWIVLRFECSMHMRQVWNMYCTVWYCMKYTYYTTGCIMDAWPCPCRGSVLSFLRYTSCLCCTASSICQLPDAWRWPLAHEDEDGERDDDHWTVTAAVCCVNSFILNTIT